MAVRFGILHVNRDILRGLTAKEFRGWEHYHELDPFTEVRDDYRTASIVQMIANVNRGLKQKPYKLSDFLLNFEEAPEKKPQTPKQQFAMLKILAAMHANDGPAVPRVIETGTVTFADDSEQKRFEEQLAKARSASIKT
jgi:hypothetical protein